MDTNKEFFNRGLPKWPECRVEGMNVSPEQAMEILIRTDGWYVSTNDQAWQAHVYHLAGVPQDLTRSRTDWGLWDPFLEQHRVLDLEYLNNDQIASCYIGGPHGWCSWDGTVAQRGCNIGKWPSVDTVYEEWQRIAEAFPFLSLRCQLFSGEECEAGSVPVVEYVVAEGSVRMCEPQEPLEPSVRPAFSYKALTEPYGERGCTPAMLKEALRITRERCGS